MWTSICEIAQTVETIVKMVNTMEQLKSHGDTLIDSDTIQKIVEILFYFLQDILIIGFVLILRYVIICFR